VNDATQTTYLLTIAYQIREDVRNARERDRLRHLASAAVHAGRLGATSAARNGGVGHYAAEAQDALVQAVAARAVDARGWMDCAEAYAQHAINYLEAPCAKSA